MTEHYDPQASYDLIGPENIKVGEVRKGIYYEGTWEIGKIEGEVFHYNGEPAGKRGGLTITRDDLPLALFGLVKQDAN